MKRICILNASAIEIHLLFIYLHKLNDNCCTNQRMVAFERKTFVIWQRPQYSNAKLSTPMIGNLSLSMTERVLKLFL